MSSGITWAMPVRRAVCCLSWREEALLSLVWSRTFKPQPRRPVMRGSEALSAQLCEVVLAIAVLPESETPCV